MENKDQGDFYSAHNLEKLSWQSQELEKQHNNSR